MKRFFHSVRYFVISGFKSKNLVFWLILFPIVLGTFFKAAFSGLYESDDMFIKDPIKTAVAGENMMFKAVTQAMEQSGNSLLDTVYTDDETALQMLKKGEVAGIIYIADDGRLSLSVMESEIEQQVLKGFTDSYNANAAVITDIVKSGKDVTKAAEVLSQGGYTKEISMKHGNSDVYQQYFYNLIAMTALYGSFIGVQIGINNQANISALGARKNCSPMPKSLALLADFTGGCILQTICMVICVTFLAFVIKTDFCGRLPLAYLASVVGGLTGVSLGFLIGAVGRWKEDAKIGISLIVTMPLCFLSGLMVGNMKGIMMNIAPWFNKINPAAVISDSIYSLSVYDSLDVYFEKIAVMLMTSAVLCVLGIMLTRRRRYASL